MNKKQSLFHIAKRDTLPWYKSFAIRGCAILLALVVCAVVTMLLTGENPVNIFATIFKGAFGSARKSWVTFQNLAVLLGISLAVTPAFKMRFWNIGAEGQVLIGCLATAACMICLADKLPNAVLILVSLAAALAAGALWGFLPAFFKAKWNTNETLFTLMMNYIATQLAAFFIIVWEVPKGAGKIGIINQGTEAGWLPVVGGQKYLLVILVVAVLTVFMYIYLNYSKHGYEIAVVGESQGPPAMQASKWNGSSSAPWCSPARYAASWVCCSLPVRTTPSPPRSWAAVASPPSWYRGWRNSTPSS